MIMLMCSLFLLSHHPNSIKKDICKEKLTLIFDLDTHNYVVIVRKF